MGALLIRVSYTFSRFMVCSKYRWDGFVKSRNNNSSSDIPPRPCTTLLLYYIIDPLNVVRVPSKTATPKHNLRLKKRLSKPSWGWWFETLLCLLWRQCNDFTWQLGLESYIWETKNEWPPMSMIFVKTAFIWICLSNCAAMSKNNSWIILRGMNDSLFMATHT